MDQSSDVNRRTLLAAIGVSCPALVAGCLTRGGGSDVQDSDGDGVIDSEDYAPNDPDVQEKSDVAGNGGGDGETTDESNPTPTEESAEGATDESTPTDEPTPTEEPPTETPQTAEPTTAELSCEVWLEETVERGRDEAATYELSVQEGARVEIICITRSGEEPGLTVISPSGERIIDGVQEQTIRESFTASGDGEYLFEFNNGAWLPETGTWNIEITVCTR